MDIQNAKAHCDVPCGIYDPIVAQIAALSVVRMVDLINGLDKNDVHAIARHILIKESEAAKCKEEVRIIWGDFIKPPHIEKYPEIHSLTHTIMALGGAVKQSISKDKALDLLKNVNRFAEIFWDLKGVQTKMVKSQNPTGLEIIYPIL